jgi:hypothetical protein
MVSPCAAPARPHFTSRNPMKARLPILSLCLLLGASSCTTSRPAPVALGPQLEATPDSLPILPYLRQVQRLDSAALAGWLPRDYASLPAYLVPPPAGSTPRQRRQWQKAQAQNLARAGVQPTKIKNSSVATAPGAVAINPRRLRSGRLWGGGHEHARQRFVVVCAGGPGRRNRLGSAY